MPKTLINEMFIHFSPFNLQLTLGRVSRIFHFLGIIQLVRKNLKSICFLTLSWRRSLSYRNQSIDLLSKSMEWFLNDRDICHERVINKEKDIFTTLLRTYGDTFLRKWLKKAKMVKSQFQYFLNIFGFSRPFSTKCSVCCF